jgi:hypothetical protein
MHMCGYLRLSPRFRECDSWGPPPSGRGHITRGFGMKARIKTILILCGFSLVILGARAAVDIAQADRPRDEELALLVILPVVALMMELVGAGRTRKAYRDERESDAS